MKNMRTIDIICPLYKAFDYIDALNQSFLKQKKVKINKVKYILTKSKDDKTEEYLINNNLDYESIEKEEFSHSLTREKVALASTSDILVFVTQDIVIEDDLWLYNLTKDIMNDGIVATYSRQISKYNNIEKYTREYNYPDYDIIKDKCSINKNGLKTFFFSDASSAISTNIFKKLNGYDHKKLPICEDMYIAYKIIMSQYKIKYCSKSVVYHSHKFSLKDVFIRYKMTGKFFKENEYIDQYGTTSSGAGLAKYILKRIIQEKKFHLLFRYPFEMAARYIGMKIGKRI